MTRVLFVWSLTSLAVALFLTGVYEILNYAELGDLAETWIVVVAILLSWEIIARIGSKLAKSLNK